MRYSFIKTNVIYDVFGYIMLHIYFSYFILYQKYTIFIRLYVFDEIYPMQSNLIALDFVAATCKPTNWVRLYMVNLQTY